MWSPPLQISLPSTELSITDGEHKRASRYMAAFCHLYSAETRDTGPLGIAELINRKYRSIISRTVILLLENIVFYPALCSVTMIICAECHALKCFKEPITGNISFNPASSSTHRTITSSKDFPAIKYKHYINTTKKHNNTMIASFAVNKYSHTCKTK